MSRRRPTLLPLVVLLAGCSGHWEPLAVPTPAPLRPQTVVQFRAGDSIVQLHGVRFSRDSISGIPWLDHLSCDTCRVSYALANISQVKTGDPGAGAKTMVLPFAILTGAGLIFALLCKITDSCHFD